MATYINKGKNESYGGELNIVSSFNPFTVEFGFSYVTSKAFNVNTLEHPEETIDLKYTTFPEYSIQAGLHYTLKPININFYLNNKVYLNMDDSLGDVNPDPKSLPPYYRMDLNMNKNVSDKLELYLNIRNVLNRENYLSSVHGAVDGYVDPGISVMLRAGYKI